MELMERLMPQYQFSEKHQLLTPAQPGALLDAVLQPAPVSTKIRRNGASQARSLADCIGSVSWGKGAGSIGLMLGEGTLRGRIGSVIRANRTTGSVDRMLVTPAQAGVQCRCL